MENRKQTGNNQGSTIIIVLVAVSFIAILATVALTISAANVQMKSVERKAKVNFYSAESALDELKASLETELSEIMESLYKETMLAYSEMSVGERNYIFKTEFIKEYVSHYASEGTLPDTINIESGTATYDWNGLEKLLTKTKDYTSMDNSGKNILEWKFDAGNKEEQYITFKNLTIEFVDDENYMSKITTDLKIQVPDVNLESIGNMPAFTDYSLIADKKLYVYNASASVLGNVYAGEDGILAQGVSASLSVKGDKLITRSAITAMDGAAISLNDNGGDDTACTLDVWAKNIETTASSQTTGLKETLDLYGNFYIADDTTLNAPDSTASFHGSYFGYGYEDTPDGSSAMIVNSSRCVLDLSDITNLFVAGRAFVEPTDASSDLKDSTGFASSYVQTGEAISTKGNQFLYRLPDACIGVKKTDGSTESIGSNPLSISDYQKILDSSDYIMVDTDYVLPFSNKKLKEYVDESDPYCTIFDQTETSAYVYFYPKFKSVYAANQYFKDYYASSDSSYIEKLKERMKEYDTTVLMPSNFSGTTGRKTFAGNVVCYEADSDTLKLYDNSVDAILPQQFVKESDDLNEMYKAYCTKLLPSLSQFSSSELSSYDTLFESLIIRSSGDELHPGMSELLGGNRTKIFSDDSEYSYLLAANETAKDDTSVFDEESALVIDGSIPESVRIIIATGDVYVKRNFTGLIISNGVVRLENGVTVQNDADAIFDLICNSKIKTVFRDYNTFGNYLTTSDHEQINISDLITTQNWKKE